MVRPEHPERLLDPPGQVRRAQEGPGLEPEPELEPGLELGLGLELELATRALGPVAADLAIRPATVRCSLILPTP